MRVLKFLKSAGKDILTFLIILTVFFAVDRLIGLLVTNMPTAVIVGVFFIFVIIIIDYLKKKWSES